MRAHHMIAGIALTGAITSCIARPGTLDRALAPGAQWIVTLTPTTTSDLHGTVTFVRTDPPTQTRAIFSLAGGTPNAVLPWHVHYGVCGNDQLIVGKPGNYPLLVFGSTGSLTAAAQLPVELVNDTRYVLHVHTSAVDKSTLACGSLVAEKAIAQARK